MRKFVISCATVTLSLFALALGPASAAPIGLDLLKSATSNSAVAEKVHWRGYRHCHRRWGYGRCHGPRHFYRGWGPGIHLYLGPRHRHWHHRRHFRHW
jgi:hypothetical protein